MTEDGINELETSTAFLSNQLFLSKQINKKKLIRCKKEF